MFNENLVILTGRAVKDAELRSVGKDSKVSAFRLANNERIKLRNGEYKEKTCFIDCDAWGPRAEFASNYVKKGKMTRVVAKLEQDEWESDGQRRQKHKLYVTDIQVERQRDESQGSQSGGPGGDSDQDTEDLPF